MGRARSKGSYFTRNEEVSHCTEEVVSKDVNVDAALETAATFASSAPEALGGKRLVAQGGSVLQ